MAFEFLKRKPAMRNIQDLEELFNLFHESVYQSAYFIVRDRMLAEDVVQDTFLKAYDKIDQLRDTSRVESWLVRIAMNKARDQLRRRKYQVTIPSPESDTRFTNAPDELPEARLLVQEEHLVLNAAIDRLALKYQEVVFLKYHREFTTEKIAETLGIPEGTVKTRLRKARTLLGAALREAGIMDPPTRGVEPHA